MSKMSKKNQSFKKISRLSNLRVTVLSIVTATIIVIFMYQHLFHVYQHLQGIFFMSISTFLKHNSERHCQTSDIVYRSSLSHIKQSSLYLIVLQLIASTVSSEEFYFFIKQKFFKFLSSAKASDLVSSKSIHFALSISFALRKFTHFYRTITFHRNNVLSIFL